MELVDKVNSVDGVSAKYVFKNDKGFMEFTKVFNEDPPKRTIVCAPTGYGCGLGCTFCHLTLAGSKSNVPVTVEEIDAALSMIDRDENIPLLVSLMGAGEPLLNLDLVKNVSERYLTSLATSMPTQISVERLIDFINQNPDNPLKVYASVHSFVPEKRAELMPNSVGNLYDILKLLSTLPDMPSTDGHAEKDKSRLVLHYTIIPGVNDSVEDFEACVQILTKLEKSPKVKLLAWSDGDNTFESSVWRDRLRILGFKAKYHAPNANDVGGACGQFNPEYYQVTK